jgi:hypothetical protein
VDNALINSISRTTDGFASRGGHGHFFCTGVIFRQAKGMPDDRARDL